MASGEQQGRGSNWKMSRRIVMKAIAAMSASVAAGRRANGIQATAQQPACGTENKSSWHGFDRYDFLMDDATLEICPFKASPEERTGVAPPPAGHHRCILVAPAQAAEHKPWSWRGVYWDHQPQTEVELLRRGFHVAYISASATLRPGREWDAWYRYLTAQHGLSSRPAFVGMSRGGEFSYTWATAHPDKVCCIYADNPGMNHDALLHLGELAWADVPLLHVCGSIDPLLGRNALVMEAIYQQYGGRISTMIKEGFGHHPHSLRDPKPIADFIEQSARHVASAPPRFVPAGYAKSYFYSSEGVARAVPGEGTTITLRGPQFAPSYEQYDFALPKIEGPIAVIVPERAAEGMPWVLHCGPVGRASAVNHALLAKGFHLVTAPVGYNHDGPLIEHWNELYRYLTACGFSTKPVVAGVRSAAGEVYAWAEANPDKVACVYGENPILHSNLASVQPLEGLDGLARAGVPLLHVCAATDPHIDHTRQLAARYQQLGGQIEVIVEEEKAHCAVLPSEPERVVSFLQHAAQLRDSKS